MGEAPAAVLGAAVLAKGGRRAGGGGAGEAVGEAVVGDAGEAVVGVVGESGVGTRGGGVAHRGRFLEFDTDTASRGVFDGPFRRDAWTQPVHAHGPGHTCPVGF